MTTPSQQSMGASGEAAANTSDDHQIMAILAHMSQQQSASKSKGKSNVPSPEGSERQLSVPASRARSASEDDEQDDRERRDREDSKGSKGGKGKEEDWTRTRKDNHKEVERRRRETINDGINDLKKIVPGCEKNKGSILQRAVQYIQQLKESEASNIEKWTLEKLLTDQSMQETKHELESYKAHVDVIEVENEQLRDENDRLRAEVVRLGGARAAAADDDGRVEKRGYEDEGGDGRGAKRVKAGP